MLARGQLVGIQYSILSGMINVYRVRGQVAFRRACHAKKPGIRDCAHTPKGSEFRVPIMVYSPGQIEASLHLGRQLYLSLEVNAPSRAEWKSKWLLLNINDLRCY